MKSSIVVVDYGMGNLRSVAKAIEHVAPHAQVEISADPDRLRRADRVVVPGQGAMPDCMRELAARGLREAVIEAAASKPFLGICVGLQMLFDEAEEGNSRGLAVFAGRVPRFPQDQMKLPDGTSLKVPHMGWNNVQHVQPHALWSGIDDDARFYFVHSYYVAPEDAGLAAGKTRYGIEFASAIARDNVFAVQFHPEKSAEAGLRLLANFATWQP